MGTGNLLARNLGIPLDVADALDVAFAGEPRLIDLVRLRLDDSHEDHYSVVMAGVGIDAQMIVNTDDDLKKKIGFLAYGVAIAKSLAGGNRIRVDYRLDEGTRHRTRVHSLIIGNCGDLVASVPLLPDAQARGLAVAARRDQLDALLEPPRAQDRRVDRTQGRPRLDQLGQLVAA